MFKLDRTVGKGMSHAEAEAEKTGYWTNKSVQERFAVAMYLNSIAYGFDINNPPKMDKTVHSCRKHQIR